MSALTDGRKRRYALQSRPISTAWPAWIGPAAIVGIALLVRLYQIGEKPFWLDEIYSLNRATASFPDMLADSLHGKHYPTYFFLLWLVAKLGASQFLLRLPSAIFGAIGTALLYAIGRDADTRRTGIVAGVLLALSPFDVQFGQEARSYALVTCLILVALWGLVCLISGRTEEEHSLHRDRRLAVAWAAFSFGSAAALNVLNVALLWLVAANLAVIPIALRAGTIRNRFFRNWAKAHAIILLLWLPSAAVVYYFSKGAILNGPDWASHASISRISAIFECVYLYRITTFVTFHLLPPVIPGVSFVLAAAAAYGIWCLRNKRNVLPVLACCAFAAPGLLLAVSSFTPVLVPRYLGWSAAPFFILAAAGFARLSKRAFPGILAAILVGAAVNLLPYYQTETKPRWDLAAQRLVSGAQRGDVVLLDSQYSYYVLSSFIAESGTDASRLVLTSNAAEAARLSRGRRLWVIAGRVGQGSKPPPVEFVNALPWLGRPVSEEPIGKYIVVWQFAEPE